MDYDYLYKKYENCDIILCIYLEATGYDLDDYNPFMFSQWEHNKFQEFKDKHGYPENKLYNEYLEYLMSS